MKSIPRGWSRRATREFEFRHDGHTEKYCVQCTVWKDKKEVAFLHTHKVCGNTGQVALRREKGKRQRLELPCPPVQPDYAHHFNGVDIQDKDSANYPTTLKTNRWYMRIFFWCLDRVVFGIWLIVFNSGLERHERKEWRKYHKKNGRFDFQIDLGLQLIDMGIRRDWSNISNASNKPKWMRQKPPIPCDCNKCFFCRTGKTSPATQSRSPTPTPSPTFQPPTPECTRGYWPLSPGQKTRKNPCVMCLRARKLSHPGETAKERAQKCKKSSKGCRRCQVEICPECWETYDHDIVKKGH
jgi:hypothetical protein